MARKRFPSDRCDLATRSVNTVERLAGTRTMRAALGPIATMTAKRLEKDGRRSGASGDLLKFNDVRRRMRGVRGAYFSVIRSSPAFAGDRPTSLSSR